MFKNNETERELQREKRIEELTKDREKNLGAYATFTLYLSNNSTINFSLGRPIAKEMAKFIDDTVIEMQEAKKNQVFLSYLPANHGNEFEILTVYGPDIIAIRAKQG